MPPPLKRVMLPLNTNQRPWHNRQVWYDHTRGLCVCVCVWTRKIERVETWRERASQSKANVLPPLNDSINAPVTIAVRILYQSFKRTPRSWTHIDADGGHPVRYAKHYHLSSHQTTNRINTGVMSMKSIISLFCLLFCGVAGRQMEDAVGMETGISREVAMLLNYKETAQKLEASLSRHHRPERPWRPHFGNCLFKG